MNRLLALLLVALAAVAVGSCDVNEYCVTCALDDGGNGDGDGGGRPDADGDGGGRIPDADGDAAPPDALCVPAPEVCNNLDDDCDGTPDESTDAEPLPQVGTECGGTVGECRPGTISCVAGVLTCSGVERAIETCDGKDNDCDGTNDDGNPGGGGPCAGACGPGINRCTGGAIVCEVTQQPTAEICDGIDNDCDTRFDEGLTNLGPCGISTGLCEPGHLECQGGESVCVGGTGPVQEICDGFDQDCDGSNTNGFDLVNDPRNCGVCGRVCNLPHALEGCASSACTVRGCEPDFYNNDGAPANGCEYGPCTFRGSTEACNGADDNCNGMTDEALGTPPISCASLGECGVGPGGRPAVTPTCRGALGWDCLYEPDARRDVSVDANGDLSPETECDGLDNDCDGRVDESHPQKGQACSDTGMGACRRTGTFICNTADEDAPLICNLTSPVVTPAAEVCDGLDNNCNGTVDDGAAAGNMTGQDWVPIGGGRQIMKYEASRPDARAAVTGVLATHACSRAGVQPWVNVKQPEAEAACTSIGARLCTEQEWHRACSVVNPQAYPIVEPAGTGKIVIEAENYFSLTAAVDPNDNVRRTWVPMAVRNFSGISGLRASPDTGQVNDITQLSQSPRLDYQITLAGTGSRNYRIWVRMLSGDGNDDEIHVGINASLTNPTAQRTLTVGSNDQWNWVRNGDGSIPVTATGTVFLSVWMQDDGAKIDQIMLVRNNSADDTTPTDTTSPGGTWAYQANATVSQPQVCNGDAFDTSAAAGDQDDIIATGSLAQCNANWGTVANRIFDMSGNVREWTAERLPGANPIRGGSSNNVEDGLKCGLSFTLADDTFFFPNVGFRCCR